MLKVAVAILAILVVGTLAFSVMRTSSIASELEKTNGEVARENEALRAKLSAAERKLADPATSNDLNALRARLTDTADDVEAVQRRVKSVGGRMALMEECIPEVQSQIDMLDWDEDIQAIVSEQGLSRRCSPVVYGYDENAIGD